MRVNKFKELPLRCLTGDQISRWKKIMELGDQTDCRHISKCQSGGSLIYRSNNLCCFSILWKFLYPNSAWWRVFSSFINFRKLTLLRFASVEFLWWVSSWWFAACSQSTLALHPAANQHLPNTGLSYSSGRCAEARWRLRRLAWPGIGRRRDG